MASDQSLGTCTSLLQRIQNSDSHAWNEFIKLYGPLVQFWCTSSGLERELARDCSQEIFFAVLKGVDQFVPSGQHGSFRAWLWTIARHKIIDALRQRKRMPPSIGGSTGWQLAQQYPQHDESSSQSPLHDAAIQEQEPTPAKQLQNLLHRGLKQVQAEFEPRTWQAFWRTTVDNQDTAVVAKELSLSVNTVRQYRSRVLRRLRQQLADLP